MKRFIELMLSLTLLTGIMAGCAGTPADNNTSTPLQSPAPATQTETPDVTGSPDASAAAWPRTIEDSLGNQITLEKKPERVAIMDFGFMETMFALGVAPIASGKAERSLYGFGTLQPYASDAQVEELGETSASNLEKLAELAPDLILTTAEEGHLDMTTYEAASKIAPVVAIDASINWKEQLRAFAECLGAEETAENYIAEVETLIVEARGKLSGYGDKTVAIMFETSNKGNFAIQRSSEDSVWYNNENGLGLTPPNGLEAEGSVSLEGLATIDPDYIFLIGSLGTEENGYQQRYLSEETEALSVWQSLTAVKNGHVYYLDAAVRAGGPLSVKHGVETIVESVTGAE